ncbi:preprotein translocase subunit SecE [Areca yellow leaf disease phytoplasma]|uniref:preprotein translocase subunit SecE n=1 Tax=Areca yellow leaf disease phytoplasma TaxID=927614 RepID=UPI0035B505B0
MHFYQICNISWPSLKQILFKTLQVIFSTLFLIPFCSCYRFSCYWQINPILCQNQKFVEQIK